MEYGVYIMTIIAYKDGILASDSQIYTDHVLGEIDKIRKFELNGKIILAGASGNTDKCTLFMNWLEKGMAIPAPNLKKIDEENDFSAFFISEFKVNYHFTVFENGCIPCIIKAPFYAIGCGEKLAIGAMEMGASAIQAVKVAIKYNPYCSGAIYNLQF